MGPPASLGEVRRRLPREFLLSLEAAFPPHVAEAILRGMGVRRRTTLRVNTLRWNASGLLRFFRENAMKHDRIPWYPDAFVLRDLRERDVQAWEAYRQGKIYVQGLSSMIPALVLDPKPGERILDLAAAPGSKTTQLSALMEGGGTIVANEVDAVRAQRLQYNVRLQGCANVEVRLGRGEKVGRETPEGFDRVLLDAPCSGEGRFLAHQPAAARAWSAKTVSECVRLQRQLLLSACRSVKPGGVLVYSTCTLNLEENERMIQWALRRLPLQVEALPLSIPGSWQGMSRGLDPALSRALRIFPDERQEGFFICRLRKERG